MVSPEMTPKHGVTRYQYDRTQAACAIAAGAAAICRNYFAPIEGAHGQTKERIIAAIRRALAISLDLISM
jgi:hypothetical protein